MQCSLYIHGVPQGQNMWGAKGDEEYCKSFYSATEKNVRLVIEILPKKNRTYFTYLHSKDFLAADGRVGSYFGMTLSVEGLYYCKDTFNLYNLFDQVYSNYIANGTIVSVLQGGKEKFVISTFSEKETQLEKIQRILLDTFAKSFADKGDICKIDKIAEKPTSPERFNLYDVDSPTFRNSLFNALKVYVSKEYPSKDWLLTALNQQINPEKEKSKNLAEACSKLQAQLTDASNECSALKQSVNSLKSTEQQLRNAVENSKKKITDLELRNNALEKEHTKKGIETTVEQIQPQLKDLLTQISKIVPEKTDTESNNTTKHTASHTIAMWIVAGVSSLCLLMQVFIIVFLLCPQLFSTQANEKSKPNKKVETVATTTNTTSQDAALSVTFENKRGNIIYKDSTYTAYVENVPIGSKTEWKVDGFNFVSGDKPSKSIKVRATDKDTAVLSLYVGNERIWTKKFTVQK